MIILKAIMKLNYLNCLAIKQLKVFSKKSNLLYHCKYMATDNVFYCPMLNKEAHPCAKRNVRNKTNKNKDRQRRKTYIIVATQKLSGNSRVMRRPEAGLGLARFSLFRPAAHCLRLKAACHVGQKHALRHAAYRKQRHNTANVGFHS
jgi:hypothetical protein